MVDRYTRAVLTVIAAALVVLALQNAIGRSYAINEVQKVQICDSFDCAQVVKGGGLTVTVR